LLSDLPRYGLCTVSPAGDQVAALDQKGTVRVWSLPALTQIAAHQAMDASQILFTAHGVAIVRSRSVEIFGGADGDFFVATPGRGGNGLMAADARAVVSPDGQLVVVPRFISNQADVVDLRTRGIAASVTFAPGRPRFAVSPANDRLLIAGL